MIFIRFVMSASPLWQLARGRCEWICSDWRLSVKAFCKWFSMSIAAAVASPSECRDELLESSRRRRSKRFSSLWDISWKVHVWRSSVRWLGV